MQHHPQYRSPAYPPFLPPALQFHLLRLARRFSQFSCFTTYFLIIVFYIVKNKHFTSSLSFIMPKFGLRVNSTQKFFALSLKSKNGLKPLSFLALKSNCKKYYSIYIKKSILLLWKGLNVWPKNKKYRRIYCMEFGQRTFTAKLSPMPGTRKKRLVFA